jgi:hypothetical protein
VATFTTVFKRTTFASCHSACISLAVRDIMPPIAGHQPEGAEPPLTLLTNACDPAHRSELGGTKGTKREKTIKNFMRKSGFSGGFIQVNNGFFDTIIYTSFGDAGVVTE